MQELPLSEEVDLKKHVQRCVRRLSTVEGQVRDIKRMIEEDTNNCVTIMTQISSVPKALRGVGKEVMRKYRNTYATNAIKDGSDEVGVRRVDGRDL